MYLLTHIFFSFLKETINFGFLFCVQIRLLNNCGFFISFFFLKITNAFHVFILSFYRFEENDRIRERERDKQARALQMQSDQDNESPKPLFGAPVRVSGYSFFV